MKLETSLDDPVEGDGLQRKAMIAAQRRARILEYVQRDGGASISAVADLIGVSPSTVRRDLDYLVDKGYVARSHGGAVANTVPPTIFEPEQDLAAHVAHGAKAAIGKRAASTIEPGQSVMFDSSSTVREAARVVAKNGTRVLACTNDIATAAMLSRSEKLQLVVLGGSLRPGSQTLLGDPGLGFLRQVRFDVALIGIHSMHGGALSETSIDVAAMKRQIIDSALNVIVLADSTKFQHPAFCEVAKISPRFTVITDTGLAAADRDALLELGVRLILVDPEDSNLT